MHIIYETSTGKIIGVLDCPDFLFSINRDNAIPEQSLIRDGGQIDGSLYYYDLIDTVLPRPDNPTTINGHILSNLPIPSTIRIGSEEFLVEDGELEMAFDLPGTYTINVDSFPFQDATFGVTVI
jgi:hypothetical protein